MKLTLLLILLCTQRNQFAEAKLELNYEKLGLTSVPEDIDQSVTKLYLSRNQITAIHNTDFNDQFPHLTYLNFYINKLKSIEDGSFRGVPLKWLSVSKSQLSVMPDLRHVNRTLRTLYVGGNLIKEISAEDISYLGALIFLVLYGNPLRTLPDLQQILPALEYLDIQDIQTFHCCNNISFLKDARFEVKTQGTRCASPPSLEGILLDDITHEELSNTRCGEISLHFLSIPRNVIVIVPLKFKKKKY